MSTRWTLLVAASLVSMFACHSGPAHHQADSAVAAAPLSGPRGGASGGCTRTEEALA